MTRIFLVVALVSVALASSVGAVGATETEANSTVADAVNETINETANETETAAPGDGMNVSAGSDVEVLQEIDPTVRLLEWEYVDGTFTMRFEADRSTSVTLTEAVQFEEGSGTGSLREHNLARGVNVVTIDVEAVGGEAAVTIVTPASKRNGQFSWVSTGQADQSTPFEDTGSLAGWLGGGSAFAVMTGLAAVKVKRKKPTEPEDME